MPNNLSRKELDDIIQWDVKNWKKALPFWNRHFNIKPGMKVLALGEREGGLSLYFAKLGCEVLCTDYFDFTDSTAEMHRSYELKGSINYEKIDITEIDLESNSFDIVVFKSVIGALGDKKRQDEAMSELHRVLKPDGALMFAENAKASILHRSMRKKFVSWAKRWRYVDKKDLENWGDNFSTYHVKSYGTFSVFGRSVRQRNFLSAIDYTINPLIFKNWRYIYFGVMIK